MGTSLGWARVFENSRCCHSALTPPNLHLPQPPPRNQSRCPIDLSRQRTASQRLASGWNCPSTAKGIDDQVARSGQPIDQPLRKLAGLPVLPTVANSLATFLPRPRECLCCLHDQPSRITKVVFLQLRGPACNSLGELQICKPPRAAGVRFTGSNLTNQWDARAEMLTFPDHLVPNFQIY